MANTCACTVSPRPQADEPFPRAIPEIVQSGNLDGKHDVDGADDVVVLGVDGACTVDHGVGRAALLAKMHHMLRAEAAEHLAQELKIADVAHLQLHRLARHGRPPAWVSSLISLVKDNGIQGALRNIMIDDDKRPER